MKAGPVLFLAALPAILADLPVHCPSRAFCGEWTFRHKPTITKVSLLQRDAGPDDPVWPELCGHDVPNTNAGNLKLKPREKFEEWAGSSVAELTLDLSHNYRVVDVNGRPGTVFRATSKDGAVGRWTTAYDEGFEVKMPHPTQKGVTRSYFSFAEYSCKVHNYLQFSKMFSAIILTDITSYNFQNHNFCFLKKQNGTEDQHSQECGKAGVGEKSDGSTPMYHSISSLPYLQRMRQYIILLCIVQSL